MNFEIAITELKLNWFQKQNIKKVIYKNLQRHLYCTGDMKSTYHNDAFLYHRSEFKCVDNKINLAANKIFKRNFKVISMWANVGNFGSKIDPHNHIADKYSDYTADKQFQIFGVCGAYYLQKPKLSGNFIADGNAVDVVENNLIFFSPHMIHWTDINQSNKDRIVVSFNGYLT